MKVAFDKVESIGILHAEGSLDASTAQQFEVLCIEHIEYDGSKTVINFENVSYISSAGLRSILMLMKKVKMQRGEIIFCNLSSTIYDVFKISGFLSILHVEESVQDAISFLETK
ncbi:STAS domain-containing protein [Halodesulfovibrio marinisediminis]|uniref:Anti-sigma factor antagonist n=1 Tax=Halodesulfovibrio marinisediminis DSM 17456 TaxID=1121457 RepID=A0A1N6I9S5_9BACT|nr:STAS domain-containing protein [Halodesulfovibrio marinisediminis]SIO28729.1 stage II sporulation protein AA (anti-sigma F factor antagonist) [Halodesulfovibrio marinisediminis DSM 17456]